MTNGLTAFVVGDSYVANSGLTFVAKNLKRILDEMGFRTVYLSCSGQTHDETPHATYIGNSQKSFDTQVEKHKPDFIISCHDPWMLVYVWNSAYRHTYYWIAYQPCEANYYPDQVLYVWPDEQAMRPLPMALICRSVDLLIAYNEFGAAGLRSMNCKPVACIHNGIDTKITFIIKNREALLQRRRMYGIQDDEILFMHIGRNSLRKHQDILLEAWQKFLRLGAETLGYKPKAKLYLHTEKLSPNNYHIPAIIQRLGIVDTVLMPNAIDFSDQDMNIMQNCQDVQLACSGAEGHNLNISNAMALGKTFVAGSFGGHTTFCEGAGILVPPVAFESSSNFDCPRAIISSKKMAEAMLLLYQDKDLREQYGKIGMEKAKALYWDVLDLEFKKWFEHAIVNRKKNTVFAKRVV